MTRTPPALSAAVAAAATRRPGTWSARSEDARATPRRRWHGLPIAVCALGLAAVGLQSQEARGAIVVTVSQQGANVVIDYSGSWDNWTAPSGGVITSSTTNDRVVYREGVWNLAESGSRDRWSGAGGGLTLQSGSWTTVLTRPDSTTGDDLANQFAWKDDVTYAPLNYVAGTQLSGSLTFNNKTLSDMGFTVGDSGTFSGGAGTVTFSVGATAVPGAGLAGLATVGLAGVSRRRRR